MPLFQLSDCPNGELGPKKLPVGTQWLYTDNSNDPASLIHSHTRDLDNRGHPASFSISWVRGARCVKRRLPEWKILPEFHCLNKPAVTATPALPHTVGPRVGHLGK